MKITELQAIEKEIIDGLKERAKGGDNDAARALLEHLRATSKAIDDWRRNKKAEESSSTQTQPKWVNCTECTRLISPREALEYDGRCSHCAGQSS